MDFDDFKKMKDQQDRSRFDKFKEAFDAEAARRGDPRKFDDFMGEMNSAQEAAAPKAEGEPNKHRGQLQELVMELHKETTDEDPRDIILRALSIYRSVVRHVRAGGTVKFVNEDGTDKTLKVRLR